MRATALLVTMSAGVLVIGALATADQDAPRDRIGRPAFTPGSNDSPKDRAGPPTVLYTLGEDATYVEGCLGSLPDSPIGCMCPLKLANGFTGQFGLTTIPSDDPDFVAFAIDGLSWTVELGLESFTVSGSGEYRRGTVDGVAMQEMTLDVSFDGGPIEMFDSGLVEVPEDVELPAIDIVVNMNDLQCFDIIMTVRAEPGA